MKQKLFKNPILTRNNLFSSTNYPSPLIPWTLKYQFHNQPRHHHPFSTSTTTNATATTLSSSLNSKNQSFGLKIQKFKKQNLKISNLKIKKLRTYPIRKQFIFESYLNLFTKNQVCLLFGHDSLLPKEWNSIRSKLNQIKIKSNLIHQNLKKNQQQQAEEENLKDSQVRIEFLRTRMITPVLKELLKQNQISNETFNQINPHLKGNLLILNQSKFQPNSISQALKIISNQSKIPLKNKNHQSNLKKSDQDSNIINRLPFVIGLIDSKIYQDYSQVEELSQLPNLSTLHSQILTLISNPSQRLLNNLELSSGRSILRTLDGYRITLQQEQDQSQNSQNDLLVDPNTKTS